MAKGIMPFSLAQKRNFSWSISLFFHGAYLEACRELHCALQARDQWFTLPYIYIERDVSDETPQTAALLFAEYICLAIMSFPYSYSVLGLVPGLIVTVAVAGSVLYTSLILWWVKIPSAFDHC